MESHFAELFQEPVRTYWQYHKNALGNRTETRVLPNHGAWPFQEGGSRDPERERGYLHFSDTTVQYFIFEECIFYSYLFVSTIMSAWMALVSIGSPLASVK